MEKEKDALRLELSKSKAQVGEAEEALLGQKAQLEKFGLRLAQRAPLN